MKYTYKTKGTCSIEISFDINDGIISNVSFLGGCNGNLKAISKLVEGMSVEEIENKLNTLINELNGLKDEYKGLIEDREDVVKEVEFVEEHLPLQEGAYYWYVDELMYRKDEIAVQYVDDDYRYPSVVFSYTSDSRVDTEKWVKLMCMDAIEFGSYINIRIYPYKDYVEKDEIFMLSDSGYYGRAEIVDELIYTCLHEAIVPAMTENEALELYDWYKIIDGEAYIDQLIDEDLADIDKKLKSVVSEIRRIELEINKLKDKLGDKAKKGLFDNQDTSDFTELESGRYVRTQNFADVDPFSSQGMSQLYQPT